jgi:hypothetical protein
MLPNSRETHGEAWYRIAWKLLIYLSKGMLHGGDSKVSQLYVQSGERETEMGSLQTLAGNHRARGMIRNCMDFFSLSGEIELE